MSYRFNKKINYNSQEIKMSPIKMTFRDYYLAFVELNEPYLANGWGWFVDIELNNEPIKNLPNNNSYIRYKPSQNISVPKTIQEYPSIRSMKSMRNLHDTSMMFEMDDNDNKHRTNKYFGSIITHSVGLITLIVVYYMTSY